jgi:hypothetical protein
MIVHSVDAALTVPASAYQVAYAAAVPSDPPGGVQVASLSLTMAPALAEAPADHASPCTIGSATSLDGRSNKLVLMCPDGVVTDGGPKSSLIGQARPFRVAARLALMFGLLLLSLYFVARSFTVEDISAAGDH